MNGRTPPPLPSLTLPVSGIEVTIHPFGRMTMDEIGKAARKALPAPEPPLNTVVGLDGKETQEPNPADPDYLAALAAHEDALSTDVVLRILRIAAAYAVDFTVDAAAVARFRKGMAAGGVDLPEDDHEVYFWHFLVREDGDLQALIAALMRTSTVTEEAVQEQVAAFPDHVPRT